MKTGKLFNLAVTALLIPLWISLFVKLIENSTPLYSIVIISTSLVIIIIFIRAVYEVIKDTDICFIRQCRKMDNLILKTRKKLEKIIAGTSRVNIMDYAVDKLREVYPPETCSGVLTDLAGKEKNPEKKKLLFLYIEQIGGQK